MSRRNILGGIVGPQGVPGATVTVTGSGLVKAVAGVVQPAAAPLVNEDVDAAAAIAYSKLALAASIVAADIAVGAAIPYSKLSLTGGVVNADVSSSAAIAYSKLALTGAILNADLAGSIAYSKLSLTGALVNADVASAAAIAGSKISPAFGAQLVSTTTGISLGSGTAASAGLVVLANNPGTIAAIRNSGNTADLVLVAASATDLYLGQDTSGNNQVSVIRAAASGNVLLGIGGSTYVNIGATNGTCIQTGNFSVGTSSPSYGGGSKVMYIVNASTTPTSNPTGGGILFVSAGQLKWLSSSGITTTIAL